jgi:hypothetical protein
MREWTSALCEARHLVHGPAAEPERGPEHPEVAVTVHQHDPDRPLRLLRSREEQAAEDSSVILLPWSTLVFRKPVQVEH